jgi:hypothetical protein
MFCKIQGEIWIEIKLHFFQPITVSDARPNEVAKTAITSHTDTGRPKIVPNFSALIAKASCPTIRANTVAINPETAAPIAA